MALRLGVSLYETVAPGITFGAGWTDQDVIDVIEDYKNAAAVELGIPADAALRSHLYPSVLQVWVIWDAGSQWYRNLPVSLFDWMRTRGITPMVTWYGTSAQSASWKATLDGLNNAYLDKWALDARVWSRNANSSGLTVQGNAKSSRIIMRPFMEMNGTWFPWAVGGPNGPPPTYTHLEPIAANRNTVSGPTNGFIPAWRYIHDRVRITNRATNVEFFFCPSTSNAAATYFPGDAWVEYVGSDPYNGAPGLLTTPTLSGLAQNVIDDYAPLASKPIVLGEYGIRRVNGAGVAAEGGTGNIAQRATWYGDGIDALASLGIHAAVTFDINTYAFDSDKDWSLDAGLHTPGVYAGRSGLVWEAYADQMNVKTTRFAALPPLPPDSVFLLDEMVDGNGTGLGNHFADRGSDWDKHPVVNDGSSSIRTNRAQHDAKAWPNEVAYFNKAVPPTANYDVSVDFKVLGSQPAGMLLSVWGRLSTSAHTGYRVRLERMWSQAGGGNWVLRLTRVVAGVETHLATPNFPGFDGNTHTIRLSMAGSSIETYFDDVLISSRNDTGITAAGRVGVGWEHAGGQASDTSNVTVLKVTGDEVGLDATAHPGRAGAPFNARVPSALVSGVALASRASGSFVAHTSVALGSGGANATALAARAASAVVGRAPVANGIAGSYDSPVIGYDDPAWSYDGDPIVEYATALPARAAAAFAAHTSGWTVGAFANAGRAVAAWAGRTAGATPAAVALPARADAYFNALPPTAIPNVEIARAERAVASWSSPGTQALVATGLRYIRGYEIQLQSRLAAEDPLWRSPIWSHLAAPPPMRIIEVSEGVEVTQSAAATPLITVPLPAFQRQTPPRTDAGMGTDCGPCCVLSAIHLTSQNKVRVGLPQTGNYNNDNSTLAKRRTEVIEFVRKKGGAPQFGGTLASQMAKGYRAMAGEFKDRDRTKPKVHLLDREDGSWRKAVDAMRAGKPVMVNINYEPIDWYPALHAPAAGTNPNVYPARHLVSGLWNEKGVQHSILVYDFYRNAADNDEPWVRYMDPLTDGRVSNTAPRPVANGLQTLPLSVIRKAVSMRSGDEDHMDGLIFEFTQSTNVAPGPTPDSDVTASGDYEVLYDGPDLPNGEYTVRHRIWNISGDYSEWAYDDSLEVTDSDALLLPEQDIGARSSAPITKIRVVLRDIKDPFHTDDAEPADVDEPAAGYFYPPFVQGRKYRSETYEGHSAWSVDFNRGSGNFDRGDWVLAAASGTVRAKNWTAPSHYDDGPSHPNWKVPEEGESDVLIEHAGRYQTLYSHMSNIQVNEGDAVTVGQRLGKISDIGNADGPHLHHKHLRRDAGDSSIYGTPIRMRFRKGKYMRASLFAPTGYVRGQDVVGLAIPTVADPDDPKVDYTREPGEVKAVIEDILNVGISEYANHRGELFYTVPLLHPQLSENLPYLRHYEVQQFRRNAWASIGEGLLRDVDITGEDAVVYGIDWLGVLGLSVETARQPEGAIDAEIDPAEGEPKGSKYIEEDIDFIIRHQLERAIADEDSPVGWIEIGTVDSMPEPTTIYAAFVQRLEFIRGLVDSYKGGQGVRSVVEAKRDPADFNQMKFNVLEDSGVDRASLRLEYGGLVQGFDLIPFGDFAVKVHGIGHRPLTSKPFYAARSASGMDTQLWGNIAKAAVWQDVEDEGDLARRVLERAQELSRIGKRVAIGIRVRGLDPKDGWAVTDAIPLALERGPLSTRFWTPDVDDEDTALSWWVIWGYEWRVFPDGHDELTLVVSPRVDSGQPLADTDDHPLFEYLEQHRENPEWMVGRLPDPDPDPEAQPLLIGIDFDTANHGSLTMEPVKEEGIGFVIGKLTQGTYFDYDSMPEKIRAAKSKGMVPGFYHFLTLVNKKDDTDTEVAFNTGTKQCDYFIAHLPKDDDGEPTAEGYLIGVDFENNPGKNGPNNDLPDSFMRDGERWQPEKLGPRWRQIRDFVIRWFQKFPTHPLFIYSSKTQWAGGSAGKDIKELNRGVFCWSAYYAHGSTTPKFARRWDNEAVAAMEDSVDHPWDPGWGGFSKTIIWQAGPLHVAGYDPGLDGDVFRGTRADLLKYTVSTTVDPDPTPDPTDRPAYRLGYNTLLEVAAAAIPTLDAGAGNAAHEKGEVDAREAILNRMPPPLEESTP